MSLGETRTLLLLGLPDSGKSTFLGALFHALKHENEDGLTLDSLPQERDYLIELEATWLSLMPLERSRHHTPRSVQMQLRSSDVDPPFTLAVPDVIGEDYENAWEHGDWPEEVQTTALDADGILLFVRADTVEQPRLIEVEHAPVNGARAGSDPWQPRDAPTQAKLCDLLEQIAGLRGGTLPSVAVLVTAWDMVSDQGLSAEGWLEWQVPLLSQWLKSQQPPFAHQAFGISAQGGDLSQSDVRSELARHAESRPLPAGADRLTRPLKWLFEERPT